MRVAALYDIHGNLPALEAVLTEVAAAGVDEVIVGGDVVPGPMPRECLQRLLSFPTPLRFVRGNGEREVLAQIAGGGSPSVPEQFREVLRWTADEFRAEASLLANWPDTQQAEVGGIGAVLFCHATPYSDSDIFTRRTPEARVASMFAGVDADLVVCGHTHMQFDRTVGGLRVINAGSVGMPFGGPGADWLLLGPEGVHLRHTDYDLLDAARRVRATRYPQAQEFADRDIAAPISEEDALAMLGRAEPV